MTNQEIENLKARFIAARKEHNASEEIKKALDEKKFVDRSISRISRLLSDTISNGNFDELGFQFSIDTGKLSTQGFEKKHEVCKKVFDFFANHGFPVKLEKRGQEEKMHFVIHFLMK